MTLPVNHSLLTRTSTSRPLSGGGEVENSSSWRLSETIFPIPRLLSYLSEHFCRHFLDSPVWTFQAPTNTPHIMNTNRRDVASWKVCGLGLRFQQPATVVIKSLMHEVLERERHACCGLKRSKNNNIQTSSSMRTINWKWRSVKSPRLIREKTDDGQHEVNLCFAGFTVERKRLKLPFLSTQRLVWMSVSWEQKALSSQTASVC